MKKSTLIGLLLGTLALASCSSYGGAHGGTYHSGASVVVGISDYDYGYRSHVYRPGFYYYSGFYYPDVHPYYRNYHRHYRHWRHWNDRDWAYYERHHRNWRSYRDWHPSKHWNWRKHDRKAWARYERDRKDWRDRDRHPARDHRRDWRDRDGDGKDWRSRDRDRKDWRAHDRDRKDWRVHNRDRKDWRAHDRDRKDWRVHNRDRKEWKRPENRGGQAGALRGYHNGNWGERVKRAGPVPRDPRERNR